MFNYFSISFYFKVFFAYILIYYLLFKNRWLSEGELRDSLNIQLTRNTLR